LTCSTAGFRIAASGSESRSSLPGSSVTWPGLLDVRPLRLAQGKSDQAPLQGRARPRTDTRRPRTTLGRQGPSGVESQGHAVLPFSRVDMREVEQSYATAAPRTRSRESGAHSLPRPCDIRGHSPNAEWRMLNAECFPNSGAALPISPGSPLAASPPCRP
jgi:hypothetical protein